ncbi:MAG: DUF559 domain-containing protein, partial [Leptolyngbyaceae bacterium]|nr:DUF559 domain-containing protein [Leptolyngbyaceae bacterium]
EKYHGRIESPREAMFIRAVAKYKPEWIDRIESQYQVKANGRVYRIDFAFTDIKLAFEIDGEHHYEEDIKAKDEDRDRALEQLGWVTVRTGVSMVYSTSARNRTIKSLEFAMEAMARGIRPSKYLSKRHAEMVSGEHQKRMAESRQRRKWKVRSQTPVLFPWILSPRKYGEPPPHHIHSDGVVEISIERANLEIKLPSGNLEPRKKPRRSPSTDIV